MNLPGLYPAAAASIERLGADVRNLGLKVGTLDRGDLDRFPALITDSDDGYTPVRMLWTEQYYDANGYRVTRVDGLSGTATSMPAFAVGGGTLPASGSWPAAGVEVELRRRLVAEDADDPGKTLGPVYEFDWPDSGGGAGLSGWVKWDGSGASLPHNSYTATLATVLLPEDGYYLMTLIGSISGTISATGATATSVFGQCRITLGAGGSVVGAGSTTATVSYHDYPGGLFGSTAQFLDTASSQFVVHVTGGTCTLTVDATDTGLNNGATRTISVGASLSAVGPHDYATP